MCFSNSASLFLTTLVALALANMIFSSKLNSEESLISFLSWNDTLLMKKLKIAGVYRKLIYFEAFIFSPDSDI